MKGCGKVENKTEKGIK